MPQYLASSIKTSNIRYDKIRHVLFPKTHNSGTVWRRKYRSECLLCCDSWSSFQRHCQSHGCIKSAHASARHSRQRRVGQLLQRSVYSWRNLGTLEGTQRNDNKRRIVQRVLLFQGVSPTAQRASVIAAVELPVYDFCKSRLMNAFGDHVANHFM